MARGGRARGHGGRSGPGPVGGETVATARQLAANLPDLLVEARRVAATVAAGWHGRRRAGPGETFWQFRPFEYGEPAHRIDWRRSAQGDHLYVREREWEAAHTVFLWADRSASMQFRSRLSPTSKLERALVVVLALADLLGRGGERIGLVDGPPPAARRDAADRLAEAWLLLPEPSGQPSLDRVNRFCELVLVSDFLDPPEALDPFFAAVAARGANVHMIQVLDPAEETFPFDGRTRFRDPEAGIEFLAGKAEAWRADYLARLAAHKETLAERARRMGWHFTVHHTDRPATEPLLFLRASLGGMPGAPGAASVVRAA